VITVRYLSAYVLGIAVAIGVVMLVAPAHPIFRTVAPSGLVPVILAGVLGGFVSGLLAPRHKMLTASLAGAIPTTVAMLFLLRHGFSHDGKNPFLWYWPAWLLPCFVVGGYLSRRYWMPSNYRLERP
jgi:hypothetical protein